MSQKDLSGRLGRWSLFLQGYDFEVEYRKGSLHIVPDALSRFDVNEIELPSVSLDINLDSEYFSAKEYSDLFQTITENIDKFADTIVSDGFVYHRIHFRKGELCNEESLWRLWLPEQLREHVISVNHNIESCHGGFCKTLCRIREKYFWQT